MLLLTVLSASCGVLQTGAWSAIGFPVHDDGARDKFYKVAGWLYQAGVFLSRSSGMLYQACAVELLCAVGCLVAPWLQLNDAWQHLVEGKRVPQLLLIKPRPGLITVASAGKHAGAVGHAPGAGAAAGGLQPGCLVALLVQLEPLPRLLCSRWVPFPLGRPYKH